MARGKESVQALAERVGAILEVLRRDFPNPTTALDYTNGLELLVATILSAQCTDARVNKVTPDLFARYRSAADYAASDKTELEGVIRETGFYRNKAKHLIALGKALVRDHDGEVPETMEELVELPGVGRKTANVVLGNWFGKPAIAVDTHVKRLSGRLGLSEETDPVKIERDLQKTAPEEDWTDLSHALILHGRAVCRARRPRCGQCSIEPLCPWPSKRT